MTQTDAQVARESITIGDRQFQVGPLDPFDANEVLADVVAVLGTAAGRIETEAPPTSIDADLDPEQALLDGASKLTSLLQTNISGPSVVAAIGEVARQIPRDRMREVVQLFGRETFAKGIGLLDSQEKISLTFRGKLGDLYRWLGFCLKVNFGPFVGEALGSIGGVMGLVSRLTDSESPDTSEDTGQSGE